MFRNSNSSLKRLAPFSRCLTTCRPPRSTQSRRAAAAALATNLTLIGVTLTGCYNANAGLAITGDNLVDGNISIAPVDGPDFDDHKAKISSWQVPQDLADRVQKDSVNPATGELRLHFSGLGFEETSSALKQVSEDTVKLDISETKAAQLSVAGSADLRGLPGSKITIAITFPEPVTESNGEVMDGATVRWRLTGGNESKFWAQSPAGSDMQNEFYIWAAVAAAAGILAALLAILWARRVRDIEDF